MPDQTHLSSPLRRWWILLIAATLLTLGASSIHGRKPIEAPKNIFVATGTVEADETVIATKTPGRLLQIDVQEGDRVKSGELVAELDPKELLDQLGQAKASLAAPQPWLSAPDIGNRPLQVKLSGTQLTAPNRPIERAKKPVAPIGVKQASDLKAEVDASEARLADAETDYRQADDALKVILAGPPHDQIDSANAALKQAKSAADKAQDHLVRWKELFDEGAISARAFDAAKAARDQAQQVCDQAGARLKVLQSGPNPEAVRNAQEELKQVTNSRDSARKALDDAKAAYTDCVTPEPPTVAAKPSPKVTQTEVQAAPIQLGLMWAGSRQDQLRNARAASDQAQKAVGFIQKLVDDTKLYSPADAVVQRRSAAPGDMLNTGSPVVSLGDLDHVWINVDVPSDFYGRLQLDQAVEVSADTLPGEVFSGRIVGIVSKAEFAPKSAQSRDQPLKLVLVVKVLIENKERWLTPGMSAKATIHIR